MRSVRMLTMLGGSASLVLFAGFALPVVQAAPAAAAVPTCAGLPATIVGTPGNDVLNAAPGGSVIVGMGGNDVVNGDTGGDVICTGDGNDVIHGGGSTDFISPGGGDDIVDGGSGDHNIVSYANSPTRVVVNLADGTESGDGNDTISNIQDVAGTPFGDLLNGDANNNELIGGGGDDTINGGAGFDELVAHGAPGDVSILNGGPDSDVLQGQGGSVVALYGDCTSASVNLDTGVGICNGQPGQDQLKGITDVTGSPGNDTIIGDAGPNELRGEGGNDVINGGDGNDFIDGGDGNDTLAGANGNDVVEGGEGNDRIDGGAGFDDASYFDAQNPVVASLATGVATGQGTDRLTTFEKLTGGDGNDTLTGGPGNDHLDGGPGNDTLNGGPGTNAAVFDNSDHAITADLQTGVATGAGTDRLINIQNLRGFPGGGNVLRGNAGANSLIAFSFDTLDGRTGNDLFTGPADSTVTLDYSSAPAAVAVNVNAKRAVGGDGTDTLNLIPGELIGSAFSDQLTCSTATTDGCELIGGNGNDTLTGTKNNDEFHGGNGNDRMVGNGGFDDVDYSTATSVNANLATGLATGQGTDTLVGISEVDASPGNDTLVGPASGGCTLFGDSGNDRLSSMGAACSMIGGGGNDIITGSNNDDVILGAEGNDIIDGRGGNDNLDGGPGDDAIFGGTGTDTIFYSGALTGVTVDLSTGMASGGGGNDRFVGVENITGSPFNDTLRGDAGNNVIDGGDGTDTCVGGGGTDTLLHCP